MRPISRRSFAHAEHERPEDPVYRLNELRVRDLVRLETAIERIAERIGMPFVELWEER